MCIPSRSRAFSNDSVSPTRSIRFDRSNCASNASPSRSPSAAAMPENASLRTCSGSRSAVASVIASMSEFGPQW
jgi:hypothetical protein